MRLSRFVGLGALAIAGRTNSPGGKQQRVAVGRALVIPASGPAADEPLSNLDAKLREQLRVEMRICSAGSE